PPHAGTAERQYLINANPHGVYLGHHLSGAVTHGGCRWRSGCEFRLAHAVRHCDWHQLFGLYSVTDSVLSGAAKGEERACPAAPDGRGNSEGTGVDTLGMVPAYRIAGANHPAVFLCFPHFYRAAA